MAADIQEGKIKSSSNHITKAPLPLVVVFCVWGWGVGEECSVCVCVCVCECVCVLTVHMLSVLKDRHSVPVCCDALQSEVPGVWVETAATGP